MTVVLAQGYTPRRVSPLGLWSGGGWRIKRYSIAHGREQARPELVAAADSLIAGVLPAPAVTATRYGVGFVGIHDGRGGNFVFVDWWEQENELHHRVFFSTSEEPGELRAATQEDPIACIWDLSVVAQEREAWIRHVLTAREPDLEAYLADRVSGSI
jgi:hypothetical protein